MKRNIQSISTNSSNVNQDVFPLDQWTITTRKGSIMQSQCTCTSNSGGSASSLGSTSSTSTSTSTSSSVAAATVTPCTNSTIAAAASPLTPEANHVSAATPSETEAATTIPLTTTNERQLNKKVASLVLENDTIDKEPIELCDVCRYHRNLPQLHSMPDMLFNNNLLRLEHNSGVGIEFNPLDALKLVEETRDPLRVAAADGWHSARADCLFAKSVAKPFDWTFTTSYRGTLLSAIKKLQSVCQPDHPQHQQDSERSQENTESNNKDFMSLNNADHTITSHTKLPPSSPKSAQVQSVLKNVELHLERELNNEINSEQLKNLDRGDNRLCLSIEETSERIDVNKLKVREEILFYDELTLYEDELADHGTAQYNLKVRVMPSSLFVLARFFLRIDGVLARINDTRIYHELNKNYVLREYTNREAKLASLNLPISTVVSPNELIAHLPLVHSSFEKLTLPELS